MIQRTSKLNRDTNETQISIEINIDGQGNSKIKTGNGMFDHLLSQISRHGLIDIKLSAKGDVEVGWHHLVEDVGILFGRALKDAVGEAKGITRTAHSYVPLAEALALSVVDFGGRGYSEIDARLTDSDLGGLSGSLVTHFLEAISREGGFNLHVIVISGVNNHHKAEAIFKSLARSMRKALTLDPRLKNKVPSTKGKIG